MPMAQDQSPPGRSPLSRAADRAKTPEESFSHPFNPNSQIFGRTLSAGTGLERIGARHGARVALTEDARREALQWALARAARNGRTAQYFARHWVGRLLLDQG